MRVRIALAVAVVVGVCGPVAGTEASTPPEAELVAVYPDTVVDQDAGEFVVVRFPTQTDLSGWRLTDGESTVRLPNATVSGRVAFSASPSVARNLTSLRVLPASGSLSLANGGETVRLRHGTPVDSVTYPDADEGERWHLTGGNWTWTPLGATDLAAVRTGATTVRAFVLPDAPAVPVETLRSADRRILLAGYTLSSRRVAAALRAAVRRGVTVRVLVDDAPVGGMTRREAAILDSLARSGVDVEVVGGERARYAFHHPKYAVVDDRTMVLTENWKPSGTGGNSSRGWGVVVDGAATADRLADVFRADAGWKDSASWASFRRNRSFEPATPATDSYPTRFPARNVPVRSVTVLVAPDNAEGEMVSLLASANESIRVEQVSIGGRNQSLLRATLRAARRGVTVRVLLSGAWYVRKENRALVRWLNERAAAEGLPLTAKLAEPRSRFEKIHAKGVIVDGERVVVGSLNWNDNSARENREVALVLRGEAVGRYYARVFRADWRGGAWRLPVGLAAVAAVGVAGAAAVARREVAFER